MTTREKVLTELKDILAVIDVEDELTTQDSVLDLVDVIFMEDDGSITADEQDQVSEIVYDFTKTPAEVAEDIVAVLSAKPVSIPEDINPFVDDIWDDLSDEEVTALTSDDGINWAEYPDHEFQEEVDDKDKDTEKLTEEDKAYEYQCSECGHTATLTDKEYDGMCPNCKDHHGAWSKVEEDLTEAYYGKDSIIDGDIPGKENSFIDLITMRFHNMGLDEYTHPIYDGESIPESHAWCPYKKNAALMFGPDEAFFQPAVDYIKTEVDREDSAWYQRQYAVVKVGDRYNRKMGEYALCIFATDDDFCNTTEMSRKGAEKVADLRRKRKNNRPAA